MPVRNRIVAMVTIKNRLLNLLLVRVKKWATMGDTTMVSIPINVLYCCG